MKNLPFWPLSLGVMLEILGKSPENQGAGVEVVGRGPGGGGVVAETMSFVYVVYTSWLNTIYLSTPYIHDS